MSSTSPTEAPLFLQALLFEKYGPRLDIDALCDAVQLDKSTIRNQIALGTFAIKTYREGRGRFADVRDVAIYFETCRKRAA